MPVKRGLFAQARKVAGLSQESLAERLGVDRTTVARWESGEFTPYPAHRPGIAEAFGISLSELDRILHDGGPAAPADEESTSPAEATQGALPGEDEQPPAVTCEAHPPAAAPWIGPNEQLREARERTSSPFTRTSACPAKSLLS